MAEEETATLVVLKGDQTGQELLEQALRVLAPEITRVPLTLEQFDLSLERRRETDNQVIHQAAAAILHGGLGLKAATITPLDPDDVGSPNALLRQLISAKVILRTGRRIPNVLPVGGIHAPISVVRMAVEGAYGAKEWRQTDESGEEYALRTECISRGTCRAVAEFSFQQAKRVGAKVFGGPKYTVSPVYEGLFKEELDLAAERHPQVPYAPELIDATYALLLQSAGEALVIPALNRDGDALSDLVLQMYGSIAGAESLILGFDQTSLHVQTVVAEAPHGTAPALQGKDVANPMAMILAGAAILMYLGQPQADQASRAIYESVFEAVSQGIATPDLRGSASTTEFTDEVMRRVESKLEIWSSLP